MYYETSESLTTDIREDILDFQSKYNLRGQFMMMVQILVTNQRSSNMNNWNKWTCKIYSMLSSLLKFNCRELCKGILEVEKLFDIVHQLFNFFPV